MRFRRSIFLPIIGIFAAGCIHKPIVDDEYHNALCLLPKSSSPCGTDCQSVPPANNVGLAVEPGLEGAHPVDFYVQQALQRNPEIQAAERRVAAQTEVVPQVTALPDPILMEAFWPITEHSPQTASGRMTNTLTLSQQFPWFGKLRLRGEIAEAETRIALTQLAQAQLKVIEEAKISYYEMFFDQQAIQITLENEKLLNDIIQFAEARYRTGQTSQQDVLRAQVELSQLRDQLIQLRKQLEVARADLARVLHTSPEADLQALRVAGAPAVPTQIDQLYEAAVAFRPELQEQLQAIVRDQRAVELAKLDFYPDVTLGTMWDAMTTTAALAPSADGKDNVGFSVFVNIPIWHGKYAAGVREAQNRTIESARRYEAARDDTLRLTKRYVTQARALEQQIALFRGDIIPRAQQTLDVSAREYQVGKVDILQLLDNWTKLLQFKIMLARLETNLGQVLASLERVIGAIGAENGEKRAESGGRATRPSSPNQHFGKAPNRAQRGTDRQAVLVDGGLCPPSRSNGVLPVSAPRVGCVKSSQTHREPAGEIGPSAKT